MKTRTKRRLKKSAGVAMLVALVAGFLGAMIVDAGLGMALAMVGFIVAMVGYIGLMSYLLVAD